jgi:hypothetical protein
MDAPMMNTDRYDEYVRDADAVAVNYLKQVKDKLIENGVSTVVRAPNSWKCRLFYPGPVPGGPRQPGGPTTHGRSGVGRWVLGSVADRLVRHSGHPVLVIRAQA